MQLVHDRVSKPILWGILTALLGAHVGFGLTTIAALSPTFDETIHLAAGYQYLETGDFRLNTIAHPPLAEMWAALPLLGMELDLPENYPYWMDVERLQYSYADLFLYNNRIDPERLLNAGRAMTLVLSLLLGFLLFSWSKRMFGIISGCVSLFLWALFPAFIAHGTLVTTDMAMTLGYAATVYFSWRWWKASQGGTANQRDALALGVSLGLLLASKYAAAIVLPVLGLVLASAIGSGSARPRTAARHAALAAAAAVAVLFLVYRFNSLSSYYLPGFVNVLGGMTEGRNTFLMGRHSVHGWVYYFPVVFLLKTPLPLLILLLIATASRRSRTKEVLIFLLFPAALYFIAACLSKLQIGQRHILPIYPFLIVWVSSLFSHPPSLASLWPRGARVLAALLFAWYGLGTARVHPWHLSYVNEIVGSQDRAYRFFTDSNVDWGQGLKALAAYLNRQRIAGVYLCYFGSGDPKYYGIRYLPVEFFDGLTPEYAAEARQGDPFVATLPRTILAISATNLQGTYYSDKQTFSFLQDITPQAIIAHSILIYDLSNRPEDLLKFKALEFPKFLTIPAP